MRPMLVVLMLIAGQPTALPPAYPRAGASKLMDNERVQVWDIAWLKQQYPLHRHGYDLVGVYYEPGDRVIVSESGSRRPISTAAWGTAFQRRGVTHIEEGASDAPLKAVFVEIKDEPRPDNGGDAAATFAADQATQLLDNERTTAWEFVPSRAAGSTSHRHRHDGVVVSFVAGQPIATFIERGTTHAAEGTPQAGRIYVFEIK